MRSLRLVLVGLAAIIAFVLSGGFVLRAFKSGEPRTTQTETSQTETAQNGPTAAGGTSGAAVAPLRAALSPEALAAARAAVEHAVSDAPDYARFFDRLRQAFPVDYETIMNQVAAASQGRDVNVDSVMSDAVAALRRAEGGAAAKAPDEALAQIFTMHLAQMKALGERDPHLCVAFLYGANVPGFPAFAADHRKLVADAAIAGLEAMDAGRAHGVDRGSPSDADFQTLDRALVEHKLTRPEIDALLDGKAPEPPIDDMTMCAAGQTYLATLAGLAPDVRSRLYGLAVDLMAKS